MEERGFPKTYLRLIFTWKEIFINNVISEKKIKWNYVIFSNVKCNLGLGIKVNGFMMIWNFNFFCWIFSWTSFTTLVMESVCLHGQIGSFQGQTSSIACKPHFDDFHVQSMDFKWSKILDFSYKKFSWTSAKTLRMEPLGPHMQSSHLQSQTSLRAGKSLFCRFLCVIVHRFLVIGISDFFANFIHGHP